MPEFAFTSPTLEVIGRGANVLPSDMDAVEADSARSIAWVSRVYPSAEFCIP